MLRDFEQRLADVLGANLTAPLAGAVDVAPGSANSQAIVFVKRAEAVGEDFRSVRPETTPGAADRRRVVKLKCEVVIEVRQRQAQSRADQLSAFDQMLYFVDDRQLRAERLRAAEGVDPGFLLQSLTLRVCEPPSLITLDAAGFFWPVNTPGQSGDPIQQVLTRMVTEPMLLEPAAPRLVAGGPAVDLLLRLGSVNAMDIRGDGADPRGFGDLLLRVTDAGGRPGGGQLNGGAAAPNGARRLSVTDGAVTFAYTPPAQPVTDILHVAFDNEANSEIGQLELHVRSA